MVLVVMTAVASSLQGSSGNEMGPQGHSKLKPPGITGSSTGASARKVWGNTLVCSLQYSFLENSMDRGAEQAT